MRTIRATNTSFNAAPPTLQELLAALPDHVLDRCTPDQITALKRAWGSARPSHQLDFRTSIALFKSRFYVVLLFGREKRDQSRLLSEGQLGIVKLALAYCVFVVLAGFAMAALAAVLIVLLYVAKCAVGINVFEGSSSLHFIYELLFER